MKTLIFRFIANTNNYRFINKIKYMLALREERRINNNIVRGHSVWIN